MKTILGNLTTEQVKKEFENNGFKVFNADTSYTNGISHYVDIEAKCLNENKLFTGMWTYEDKTMLITVRISDHFSGLSRGNSMNKVTYSDFLKLLNSNAISA